MGGVPAKYICKSDELYIKYTTNKEIPVFDESYTIRKKISDSKKREMINALMQNGMGLVK